MTAPDHGVSLEEQIDQWRSYLRRRQAIHSVDVTELEDHLREQVAGLVDAGLATLLATVVTAAYFLLGAAVFWRQGTVPQGAAVVSEMSAIYTRTYGGWSYAIFAAGAYAGAQQQRRRLQRARGYDHLARIDGHAPAIAMGDQAGGARAVERQPLDPGLVDDLEIGSLFDVSFEERVICARALARPGGGLEQGHDTGGSAAVQRQIFFAISRASRARGGGAVGWARGGAQGAGCSTSTGSAGGQSSTIPAWPARTAWSRPRSQ